MMFLDELTNFGFIPDLPTQLTILRHAHVPIVMGIQDVEQLRAVYGQSDAKIVFSQPATRVFFKPNEIDTATVISKQLGKGSVPDLTTMRVYPRQLMAPEEVLTLDEQRAICFTPTTRNLKLWRIMPGTYGHCAGEPPLPKPVPVDDSLIKREKVDQEMVSSAQRDFPDLFDEPATEKEEDQLRARQNGALNKNIGEFKRRRSRKIVDRIKREKSEHDRGDL
jgi:hypothetical protein